MRPDEGTDLLCFAQSTSLSTVELSLTNNIHNKVLTRNSSQEWLQPLFFDQKSLLLSSLPRELLLLIPRRADPCSLLNKNHTIP
jgi:putative SOS response-associated peptidase YedK